MVRQIAAALVSTTVAGFPATSTPSLQSQLRLLIKEFPAVMISAKTQAAEKAGAEAWLASEAALAHRLKDWHPHGKQLQVKEDMQFVISELRCSVSGLASVNWQPKAFIGNRHLNQLATISDCAYSAESGEGALQHLGIKI